MKRLSAKLLFLALLPLALASQGCSTYSYFDLDLKTGTGFDTVAYGRVVTCHMFVTGGASEDFTLDYAACHLRDPATGRIGKIQYSTFADSGASVTFTLRLFGNVESNDCEMGHASSTLTVDGGKTVAGEILVPFTGPPSSNTCH